MTTAYTVHGILTDHFGMSDEEAHDTMMAVDARDDAVVARASGAPARELAALKDGGSPSGGAQATGRSDR